MKKYIPGLLVILLLSFIIPKRNKPVFYIIGDSTVRNGSGTGADKLWGWGSFMADHFDTTKWESVTRPLEEEAAAHLLPKAVGTRYWHPEKRRLCDHAIRA